MKYAESEDIDYGIVAEPEVVQSINKELNLARKIVDETGTNLFLTGKAGTGKTTFLKRLKESSPKRMVVLAPTGVAAINAGGMTIHSFFQFPFSPFIPGRGFLSEDRKYDMSAEKKKLINALDLIVIDEISMVRPDLLDAIDDILKRIRRNLLPFGGVQLLLIGDLRQLAPVVRSDEWELMSPHYATPYFFESQALRKSGFLTVELQTIYRQQDPEFISILNSIRDGVASQEVLAKLNCRIQTGSLENDDRIIRLTTHNRIADDTNLKYLRRLGKVPSIFNAEIKGKFPRSSYPADEQLLLAEGARVMFIKNDIGTDRKYYNGMIGTVVSLNGTTVTVLPDEGGAPIETGMVEWENTSYSIDKETGSPVEKIDGVFSQIPLRLAWAITIHKSQGLTFDRAVIDACNSFAPGQLYVALSRCRSLQGLFLHEPLRPHAVIIDHNVNNFIDEARSNKPSDEDVSFLKDEFCRRQLSELFNFYPLKLSFEAFKRCVVEYVIPFMPDLHAAYFGAEERMKSIVEVGEKFNRLYASQRIDSESLVENQAFQDKIHGGCKYFLEQLEPICELLNRTPVELDNREYEKRLNARADELYFEMSLKKTLLKGIFSTSFSVTDYMNLKAKAVVSVVGDNNSKGKSSRKKKEEGGEKKSRGRTKPKGYSQRETLKMVREGLSVQSIAKVRGLTLSTICNHIGEMIELGELQIGDIIPAEIQEQMAAQIPLWKEQSGNPDSLSFFAFLRTAFPDFPEEYISVFNRVNRPSAADKS